MKQALEALEEIALAGMSGSGQESREALRDWHARRAWEFIGIAARAKEQLRTAIEEAEKQRMTQDDKPQSPCACLGARNIEPYCDCLMITQGLRRSDEHKAEKLRVEHSTKAAIPKVFGWEIKGSTS